MIINNSKVTVCHVKAIYSFIWRGILLFNLGGIVGGFITGTILYFIFLFIGVKQAFTDDDTLTLILCIFSISLAVILFLIDNGREGLVTFQATVVAFSYHAVFWYFTINNYDYTNVWDALGKGFVNSAIYVVIILIVGFLIRRYNLPRILTYIRRVKREKQRIKLRKEIRWLNTSVEKILEDMRGYLSRLDDGFTKTPADSRNLLYLLSSISNHEYVLKLSQRNVAQTKNTTLDNINRLSSSINELRAVTNKVKLYQNINTIKEQIAEFERTMRHLDECVKKQDSTLLDIFKQEDHRILYVEQVKYEYRNLVDQFSNLN